MSTKYVASWLYVDAHLYIFPQLDNILFRLPMDRLKAHSDVFTDMFFCGTPQDMQEGSSDAYPICLPFPKMAFQIWLDFVFDPKLYVHLFMFPVAIPISFSL